MTTLGSARSGKIMVIVRTAIYGAYAAGGPIGMVLHDAFGFNGVLLAAALLPLPIYPALHRLDATPILESAREKPPVREIVRLIWKHGTVVALQGVGFVVIGTFISLYFLTQGWPHAGWALTCFGVSFIIVRFVFGGLPDRVGGVSVTLYSLCLEAAGLLVPWLAPDVWSALLGASLTGLGCSLAYPSMGKEAIIRVPDKLRGTTYGLYAAFQDVSYAFTGPVAGFIADWRGYGAVFLFGGVAVGVAVALTMSLRSPSSPAAADRHGP